MTVSMTNKFQNELLPGEKILWTGQPEASILFTKADIFLVPFSLLWFGFAVFWETSALLTIPKNTSVGLFFPLFGSFFVIFGFYYAIGRFFFKNFKKKQTYYAVTDKRILVLCNLLGKNVQAAFIDSLSAINKTTNTKGVGSIIFGNQNSYSSSYYANTGLDLINFSQGTTMQAFYDIKNVNTVYEKIISLRNKQN